MSEIVKTNARSAEVLKIRCCTWFSSISRIFFNCSVPSGENVTILSRRFMNSGVNFFRAASMPVRAIFPVILSSKTPVEAFSRASDVPKPSFGAMIELISEAPRLDVMKIIAREKSTLRLSPSVSVALSRIPNKRFQSASEAFSISSNKMKLTFMVSV